MACLFIFLKFFRAKDFNFDKVQFIYFCLFLVLWCHLRNYYQIQDHKDLLSLFEELYSFGSYIEGFVHLELVLCTV